MQSSIILVVAIFIGIVTSKHPKPIECANPGSCASLPTLSVENDVLGVFENQIVTPPKIDLANETFANNVLGEADDQGEKHIYVDLDSQTLSAYEGNKLFMQTPISSGKWGRTPPGEYTIWVKMRSTRMAGGSGSDYYNLPNVPYVMFFYNPKIPKISGYSLHGAYWHNNFGHAMSHGCVNMRQIDAEKIYNWASPENTGSITYVDPKNTGTKITIY